MAPFKSQNMALNSYITEEGLEMGRAQVMQAEAAGIRPESAMNPVLLKPTSHMGSQVIVNGEVLGNYSAAEYFKMKKSLIPEIKRAYDSLAERFDVIVVEGAGSPAEINLRENDIVNMGLAELIDAPVLLAGDIDRGGVFAQLYGTAALLSDRERARIRAFIINKFRGDKEILKPGLSMLYERCPIPVAGVVPYMDVDLDDEDSLADRLWAKDTAMSQEWKKGLCQDRRGAASQDLQFYGLQCPGASSRRGPLLCRPAGGAFSRRPGDPSRHEKYHGRSEVAQGNGDGGGHFKKIRRRLLRVRRLRGLPDAGDAAFGSLRHRGGRNAPGARAPSSGNGVFQGEDQDPGDGERLGV